MDLLGVVTSYYLVVEDQVLQAVEPEVQVEVEELQYSCEVHQVLLEEEAFDEFVVEVQTSMDFVQVDTAVEEALEEEGAYVDQQVFFVVVDMTDLN